MKKEINIYIIYLLVILLFLFSCMNCELIKNIFSNVKN